MALIYETKGSFAELLAENSTTGAMPTALGRHAAFDNGGPALVHGTHSLDTHSTTVIAVE